MSHVVEVETNFFSKKNVFWSAFAVAAVFMILIGAVNFASNARSGPAATAPGAGFVTYAVGEKDEVSVHFPPKSWANVCTDKSVIVRVDSKIFRLDYPCKVFAQDKSGSFVPTETMGDTTSGIYHVKAAPGTKMAEVTVSSVRK